MSYNLNVNDDFYDQRQNQAVGGAAGNYDYSTQLNFADMNSGSAPVVGASHVYNPATQFYDPTVNYYSSAAATSSTTAAGAAALPPVYADWSSQSQFFSVNQLPADKNDPFGGSGVAAGRSATGAALNAAATGAAASAALDFENEPPLLEELGINFEHIYRKTRCVLNPFSKPHESIIHDEDLAGPLVFCVAYGFSLLLMGKIQFGYIYGITALGCVCMYSLLNLMSEKGVSAVCIGSTLGYCLLPMVILSFLSSLVGIGGYAGLAMSLLFILWCSISSSKLFVYALNMSNQQLLVLYPCFLLYGIFGLLNFF